MKKVLSMILALTLCLAVGTPAMAATWYVEDTDVAYAVTGGNIYFRKSSGAITGCDDSVSRVAIPGEIGGKTVTNIYGERSSNIITGISFSKSAFLDCTNLISVSMSDNIVTIGDGAFDGCTGLAKVQLSNNISGIGNSTFRNCESLSSVTIPDGVLTIGANAFYNCSTLSKITIPQDVLSIGARAFRYCWALKSITFLTTDFSVGTEAFDSCSNLTDIYFNGNEAQWNALSISDGNSALLHATIHYNSTGPDAIDTTPTPNSPPAPQSGSEVHFSKSATYTAGQFSDVNAAQWYNSSVASAVELGLMKGNGNGVFNPSGEVTLAEAITMACRLHSIYHTGTENFVQTGAKWYQVYLDYAYNNGIIPQSYYTANVEVKATRAQFAEILSNALPESALPAINTVVNNAIPDVSSSASYAAPVYQLYRAGILTGSDSKGTFNPDSNITRAEVSAIVSRMAESDSRRTITLDKPAQPQQTAQVDTPTTKAACAVTWDYFANEPQIVYYDNQGKVSTAVKFSYRTDMNGSSFHEACVIQYQYDGAGKLSGIMAKPLNTDGYDWGSGTTAFAPYLKEAYFRLNGDVLEAWDAPDFSSEDSYLIYAVDQSGNLVYDGSEDMSFRYPSSNGRISRRETSYGEAGSYSTDSTYTYDSNGNITSVSFDMNYYIPAPLGQKLTYENGRVVSVVRPEEDNSELSPLSYTFVYSNTGEITEVALGGSNAYRERFIHPGYVISRDASGQVQVNYIDR